MVDTCHTQSTLYNWHFINNKVYRHNATICRCYDLVINKYDKVCKKIAENTDQPLKYNYPMIVLQGGVVGIIAGLVGAGGGF